MAAPRMTLPTQLVLRELLSDPAREMYGLEICEATGLPSGTIHPILARLEGLGWLTSHWENPQPGTLGRPPRRYYCFTTRGVEQARLAMAALPSAAQAIPHLHSRPI